MIADIILHYLVHRRFISRLYQIDLRFIFPGQCIFKVIGKYFTTYFKRFLRRIVIDFSHADMEWVRLLIRHACLQEKQQKPFINEYCHSPKKFYVYKSPDYFHNYVSVFSILPPETVTTKPKPCCKTTRGKLYSLSTFFI